MRKEYSGKKLVLSSRYKKFFTRIDEDIKKKVIKKINVLIKENNEYCDKGNYNHLANIFSALSFYQVLKEYTTKESALKLVSEEMWKTVEKSKAIFQQIMKIPFMFKMIGWLLPKMFKMGSGYGWKYTFHMDTATNDYLQFECNECIYKKIFSKYNVPELGPMF